MHSAEQIKTHFIKWLIKGGLSFDYKNDSIGAEVFFSQNQRQADLLILSKHIHAIEIKSDYDNTLRLRKQLMDYVKTFEAVSILITPKHLQRAKKIINDSTGIMIFENNSFLVKRKPKIKKRLSKYSLLMFLKKKALISLLNDKSKWGLPVDQIRSEIANKTSTNRIREAAYDKLKERYGKLFRFFMKDTGGKFLWDELRGLSGNINSLTP